MRSAAKSNMISVRSADEGELGRFDTIYAVVDILFNRE